LKLLKNISIIYSFILIISFSNLLFASNNFNLIADQISISDEGDKIIAQGNVKIYSSNKVLNAEKIIYNNSNYLVQVYGPIKIIDDNNITITADYSLVSKDLKKIISSGVKALFEDYFKITSEEIKYNSGGKTKFKNSIGTSCKICSEDTSPPLWNIKSKLIVHDQDNKTLIFKNALLEIGGIPVFYTPYLKTPQPGVKRASGFLTPSIISSDINGYGIKQPYFIVLNNNSDLTVSLFKTNQTILFETEYRANLKNENINIKSTLEPNITNKKINGFINVKGEKIYPESFNLEYDFTLFDKKKSVPLGMIVSVFKAKSLKEISKLANKQEHFEHPSLYFYQEGKNKFKIKNLKMPNKWCSKLNPRLTLDTKEDYIFLKKIYNDLKHKDNFTLIDIFRLLKNKRNYLSINKNIKQKIPSTLKKSKLNL